MTFMGNGQGLTITKDNSSFTGVRSGSVKITGGVCHMRSGTGVGCPIRAIGGDMTLGLKGLSNCFFTVGGSCKGSQSWTLVGIVPVGSTKLTVRRLTRSTRVVGIGG
ncbi:hypothetical protein Hdeb2414_s0022g00612711 [Helianthus debilis subsp. tardiflorus]